ncbi:MAG: energy transducer TonB [Flavobacteriaceae bacterium]|nr:energy transducer TonB [Flavobacteriaceae bacterium]
MEPKKNPKVDLTRRSGLFFQVGLVAVLLITWIMIEWKSYDRSNIDVGMVNMDEMFEEEIPVVDLSTPPPPPPPPPAAPEVLEVVEDEKEVEETIIQSTEATQQTEIVKVETVEVEEEVEDVSVPFAVIEDVPLFPGCEKVAKDKRRDCFQEKMNDHIRDNFQYPEIAQEMGIQGRVYVQFTIAKDGSITDVRMRGPDKNLEKEAARIISKLPKMIPGKQRGKAVKVPFSIPINFKLQ